MHLSTIGIFAVAVLIIVLIGNYVIVFIDTDPLIEEIKTRSSVSQYPYSESGSSGYGSDYNSYSSGSDGGGGSNVNDNPRPPENISG